MHQFKKKNTKVRSQLNPCDTQSPIGKEELFKGAVSILTLLPNMVVMLTYRKFMLVLAM